MIRDWILLLVAVAYVGLLFLVAHVGERKSVYPRAPRWRGIIYGLALAVYCSSWTFYGAVGTAARSGLAYVPIYLGPLLLFVAGAGFLRRLARVVRRRKITSIGDFIGARFGKSRGLAALVAIIAVIAIVPYVALQFKAVATSFDVLGVFAHGETGYGHVDVALWCALLLAMFAILFGTRTVDASGHHPGLVLAVALESTVKLLVFVAVAVFAIHHGPGFAATVQRPLDELRHGLPPEFFGQTILAACAMFCLPRQFQVGAVECEDGSDLRHARWLFPTYMLIIIVAVLPIVAAGSLVPQLRGTSADTWMLALPMAYGNSGVALLAFIGGFSAATGMVIVGSVALSTMISNDLVIPMLLRVRALRLEQREDLSGLIIAIRRIAIIFLAAAAYGYYRVAANSEHLAAMGLLAFAAVVQFAPAIIAALYWRGASRRGVMAGLIGGFLVWAYTLLLPTLMHSDSWLRLGPFGVHWLRPQALFGISEWHPLMQGTFWSLLLNVGCMVFFSLRFRPGLHERLAAAAFLDVGPARSGSAGRWRGRIKVADLHTIAERIVGEQISTRAFADYAAQRGIKPAPTDKADRALMQYTERLLASAVGAASAHRILVSALSGSGLDVAEAVALLDEASQEVRFNRDLLATILGNVAQGISVIDARMRLVAWNRRYLELFDYPDGMVRVGVPVADLIAWNAERGECGPGDVAMLVARRVEYMRAGSPHIFQHVRPDGAVIEMRGRALPDGGYVTTYSDVTDYKRAEEALVEVNATLEKRVEQRTAELSDALTDAAHARQAAEAANVFKSRFLAAASHDLVQPLHAARLFTAALRTQPELSAPVSRLAERIDTSFHAAEDLLDALLHISRLDAGRYVPEITDFALTGVFDSLRDQFAVVARQRGLRFRVVPTTMVVRSDSQLLRRIIQNLVSNALRYTRSGGVLLGVRRTRDGVRIEVCDSGPGIAPEQHARIFEEFQRLDQPSPWGEKGLGLGLSICSRLAGILGHRLELRSRIDHGSCFMVTVPRAKVRPALPCKEYPQLQRAGTRLPRTVLCIDDDHGILDGMQALLERWGVDCRVAADIDAARDELMRAKVDVILVDHHLAGATDGLQAVEQLRQALGQLPPVVMITADGGSALQKRVHTLGYPILLKPIRPGALRAVLSTFVLR